MAEDKKKEKPKEKPAGWDFGPIEWIIVLLFLMALFSAIASAIWGYLALGEFSFYNFKSSGILRFFKSNIQFFKALGFIVAGASAVGTLVFTKRADTIWREEKTKLYPVSMPMFSLNNEPAKNPMTEKWEKIIKNSESQNLSEWRLAIIEADIILDELLDKLQLSGETMGEKLKAVEKSDFTTIEYAWEAHKARNMIAHEGSDFLINQREVRRIISLYEAVFKEFFLI